MKQPPIPQNEAERLRSLREHQLMGTLPEAVYDDITRLATELCGTPISLLTFVDENRQWFKSKQGLEATETPREYSFCAHAIVDPNEVFVVEDARYDERFEDNPLTTGDPHVVFYAGVPVKDAEGNALGSLCVIDNRPRQLTPEKLQALKALAKLVNVHIELRKVKIDLIAAKETGSTIRASLQALKESPLTEPQQHLIRQMEEAIGRMSS
jgi:GAF domain-containing protein